MITTVDGLLKKGEEARKASKSLARATTSTKNCSIAGVAKAISDNHTKILDANNKDFEAGIKLGFSDSNLDRIRLTRQRLESMIDDLQRIVELPDPVGEVFDMQTRPNGLLIGKKRVPLGVVGSIYEMRPNVTVDVAAV